MSLEKSTLLAKLALASDLLESGESSEALRMAQNILKGFPENVHAMCVYIDACMNLEKFDEAKKYIESHKDAFHDDQRAWYYMAQIMIHKEKLEDASRFLDRALAIDPDDFDICMSKAQVLYWLMDPAYRNYFEKAMRIDGKRARKFKKKFWVEAIPAKEDLGAENVLENMDKAALAGNIKDALYWLRVALEMKPPKFLFNELKKLEIKFLCSLEMTCEAAKKLEEYTFPPHDRNFANALIRFHEKNFEDALASINKAIEIMPGGANSVFLRTRACILEKLGDASYKDAEQKAEEQKEKEFRKIQEDLKKSERSFKITKDKRIELQ